jgi:hypothetical protein
MSEKYTIDADTIQYHIDDFILTITGIEENIRDYEHDREHNDLRDITYDLIGDVIDELKVEVTGLEKAIVKMRDLKDKAEKGDTVFRLDLVAITGARR